MNFKNIKEARDIKIFCSTSKQEAESSGVTFPGALVYNSADSHVLMLPFHNNIDATLASVTIPAFSPTRLE